LEGTTGEVSGVYQRTVGSTHVKAQKTAEDLPSEVKKEEEAAPSDVGGGESSSGGATATDDKRESLYPSEMDSRVASACHGVSEETTTGVMGLEEENAADVPTASGEWWEDEYAKDLQKIFGSPPAQATEEHVEAATEEATEEPVEAAKEEPVEETTTAERWVGPKHEEEGEELDPEALAVLSDQELRRRIAITHAAIAATEAAVAEDDQPEGGACVDVPWF
jgi:uncharacterized small protein (DUF1192 family)